MKTNCPVCLSPNDGHQAVDGTDDTPDDGDISMCVYCGTLSRYRMLGDKAKLELIPRDELVELMKDPDIQKALAVGRALSAQHRG